MEGFKAHCVPFLFDTWLVRDRKEEENMNKRLTKDERILKTHVKKLTRR